MTLSSSVVRTRCAVAAALLAVTFAVPPAGAAEPERQDDEWKFQVDLYGWLPSVRGKTMFTRPSGSSNVSVDAKDILESLNGVFMGGARVSKGRWGAFTDLIYLDLGNDKSATRDVSFTRFAIPAGASLYADYDLSGFVWTAAGTYAAVQKPHYNIDLFAGFRYLQSDQSLSWNFSGNVGPVPLQSRSGSVSVEEDVLDGIVGARGRATIGGSKWFVPYYLDIGTGGSDFTWQGMGGLGYSFRHVDLLAAYRHLAWNFSSSPLEDLEFTGPMVSVSVKW